MFTNLWDLFPPLLYCQVMENQDQNTVGQPPSVLVAAMRKLFRPLVRLMLSYQITYPFLITLLKSIFVEVAEEDFSIKGKRSSDSRINLLTGVHRKDVKRLRAEASTRQKIPGNVSIGAQLIAVWMGHEKFRAADGSPCSLSLRTGTDHAKSIYFDDLVTMVCKQDIRPRVILDEWLNLGVATLDAEGRVHLNTGVFIPEKGFDEKVFFFAKNIHDHISASSHNLKGNKPSYFDRSVYYDKLSAESIEKLNELSNQMGMQALTAINRAALQLQKADESRPHTGAPNSVYRMNFGIFNYHSHYIPEQQNTEADSKAAKSDSSITDTNKGRNNA